MQLKTGISYNLDALCFLNIMTQDEMYVSRHKSVYEQFYPLISPEIKQSISGMVTWQGNSMLSPKLTLLISSLPNFNDRNLIEMLNSHAEIETCINQTPYKYTHEELKPYFAYVDSAIIPLIKELEALSFYKFWQETRLPMIKAKCEIIDKYLTQYDVELLMKQYNKADSSDITVYLCSFTDPLGIALCGNNVISDSSYKGETILSNITHEAFHPPYNAEAVRPSLDKLAQKPWVKAAFENQNPSSGYNTMDGFIEENIVEALGIFVLVKLGVDIEPMEYFKAHDGGSHVISPYFYEYLCAAEKDAGESFEDFFVRFADGFNQ